MAIKDIIAKGVGFTPGGIKFMATHGFAIGEEVVGTTVVQRVCVAAKFAKPAIRVVKEGK